MIENASDFKKEQSTLEWSSEVSTPKLNEQKVPDLGIDIYKAKEECSLIGFTAGTEKYGDCVMKPLGSWKKVSDLSSPKIHQVNHPTI